MMVISEELIKRVDGGLRGTLTLTLVYGSFKTQLCTHCASKDLGFYSGIADGIKPCCLLP